jgi:hypothetical protein
VVALSEVKKVFQLFLFLSAEFEVSKPTGQPAACHCQRKVKNKKQKRVFFPAIFHNPVTCSIPTLTSHAGESQEAHAGGSGGLPTSSHARRVKSWRRSSCRCVCWLDVHLA